MIASQFLIKSAYSISFDRNLMKILAFSIAVIAILFIIIIFMRILNSNSKLIKIQKSSLAVKDINERINYTESNVASKLYDITNILENEKYSYYHDQIKSIKDQRLFFNVSNKAPILIYGLEISEGSIATVSFISEMATHILGYDKSEIMTSGWKNKAVHPDDTKRIQAMTNALTSQDAICMEYRLRRKDGSYIWVCDTLSRDGMKLGPSIKAVGSIIDITASKAAEIQLVQAEKMASLGRMAAGITHELNQPLNLIKLAAYNLRLQVQRGQLAPELLSTKLDGILNQIDRASNIIQQMGVFARMPSDASTKLSIAELIDNVGVMVAPQLLLDKVILESTVPDGDAIVYAPPTLLEQVFLNLILNGRDAICERQLLGRMEPGVIRISIQRGSDEVTVHVDDNGTGIPLDVIEHLFDPFFTTKPPRQGTGLGLSIAFGVIRDLGGKLTATNIDHGARFTITLPMAGHDLPPTKS
jgi:PAS domain S-box-containing protein